MIGQIYCTFSMGDLTICNVAISKECPANFKYLASCIEHCVRQAMYSYVCCSVDVPVGSGVW